MIKTNSELLIEAFTLYVQLRDRNRKDEAELLQSKYLAVLYYMDRHEKGNTRLYPQEIEDLQDLVNQLKVQEK